MKVIKPGKSKKPLRITCGDCGAVVEAMPDELRYEADSRDGDAYVLTCPECKQETWVNVRPPRKYEDRWS